MSNDQLEPIKQLIKNITLQLPNAERIIREIKFLESDNNQMKIGDSHYMDNETIDIPEDLKAVVTAEMITRKKAELNGVLQQIGTILNDSSPFQ